MRLDEFDFEIPSRSIGRIPIEMRGLSRDDSKFMVVYPGSQKICHDRFRNIGNYIEPGDVLVINDTISIPNMLEGRLENGQNAKVIIYGHNRPNLWQCRITSDIPIKTGMKIYIGNNNFSCKIKEECIYDLRDLECKDDTLFMKYLQKFGKIGMESYIDIPHFPADTPHCQTIFAQKAGSTDIPSAALHFTKNLIDSLKDYGVQICFITLHISFSSIANAIPDDKIESHIKKMVKAGSHREWYEVSPETADIINRALEDGKRVIPVGTTSIRTLETVAKSNQRIQPKKGWTDLYIMPGYDFKVAKGLITNFHPPRSGQLVLCATFLGVSYLKELYKIAIQNDYLFYEFGDSMMILP